MIPIVAFDNHGRCSRELFNETVFAFILC